MDSKFKLDKLRYFDVQKAAWDFLVEHNRHEHIPIPVEEIAEFDLGLNIIPINRLRADFDIEGFISSSFKNLYVDLDTYEKIPTRYRYTLAHEIGHYVLHREAFQNLRFDSTEEWKNFASKMDEDQRGWMEYQGYTFAGCLLVPENALKKSFTTLLYKFSNKIMQAKAAVSDKNTYVEYLIDIFAKEIAPEFDVSLETAKKRIKALDLHSEIP